MSKFNFQEALVAFNNMYGMQVSKAPTVISAQRLKDFKQILLDEVNEIDVIINKMGTYESVAKLNRQSAEDGLSIDWSNKGEMQAEIQTDLADLLGDIQVYCGSEMVKWGLPVDATLRVIMESNMSKLGADGKPIISANGKLEKGPNYWKPEPVLKEVLTSDANNPVFSDNLAQTLINAKRRQAAEKQG